MAPLILLFSSITFGLFWVVFRYNLLYVTVSRPNTRGLLYPTALNQLFTGVYVMELCMIGLFLLARDDRNKAACVGQAVVMIIATAMTLGFQYLLNDAFAPLLRFMPQTEEGEAEEEPKYNGTGAPSHLGGLVRRYSKWFAPTRNRSLVDRTFADMHHEMDDSAANESHSFIPLGFQHGSLCVQRPVVWVPDDPLGISDDEISRIKQQYGNVRINNEHANLDEIGRVTITQDAGALSDIEWMKL